MSAEEWLEELQLRQYWPAFAERGLTRLELVAKLGACSGDPVKAGWGVVLQPPNLSFHFSGTIPLIREHD